MAQVRSIQNRKSARALHGIVFAKRVAFPIVWKKNTAQIGMALKANTEQVKNLAFMPVGGRPNGHHRLDDWIISRQTNTQANNLAPRKRQQMIIQFEAR